MKHIKKIIALLSFAFLSITFVNAVTLTPVNPLCNGTSTGSITLTGVSGGAGPDYTYLIYNSNPFPIAPVPVEQFSSSDDFHTFSNLPAHKYWIYVLDKDGEVIITLTSTLSDPPVLVLPAPVITDASCSGIHNGKISVSATGGTAPYSYDLKKGGAVIASSGVQAGAYTFTGLQAGNDYSVVVTDANSCGPVNSGLLTVSEPVVLSASVSPNPGVVCAGLALSLTATPVGGNGGETYSWSAASGSFSGNTQTTNYTNPTAGGPVTATVTVTDSKGCSTSANTSITINSLPAKPSITPGGPTTFCTGGSVGLTSSPGISYLWSNGATTSSITANSSGSYTVQVTNINGCLSLPSNPVTVTVNTYPVKPTITAGGPTTFCAGGNVVLTSSPEASYLWSNGATTSSITVGTADNYTVRVTNAGGCQSIASDPTVVTVNALPAKPTITAGGPTTFCSGGSVVLNASAGSSYLWSNGATTSSITVNTAGNYTVQVTNASGCVSPASDPTVVTVNALPAKPTITAGGSTTFCSGGSVVLTASAGSSYLWSTGATTQAITVNTAGSYTVQVTNASGCLSPASDATVVTVNALPAKPTITAGGPTTFCTGGNVVLTASAGTTYLWSNGATTSSITVSTTGSYTVQVTNVNGCLSPASDATTVTVNALPAKPTITAGGPTTFCSGGSVVLTASAGSSYLWSNGATTSAITVNTAGSYTVQVTNASGCLSPVSDAKIVTVNALPAKPTITAGGPTTFCSGGSVVLTASAGSSYLWSNGATTSAITVNTAGSYTVQVTNASGCLSPASDPTVVTVNALPAKPTITAGGPTTFCSGGSVVLNASAGSSYLWSNGATTSSITVNTAGSYTVQVTNASGCVSPASDPTVVTVNALPAKPTITAGGSTTFCSGGSVVLTASAGSNYLWSTGATTQAITVNTAGSYTVQVTNASGCLSPASDATLVTVNALPAKPTITAGGPTTFCTGGNVVLTASAGTSYLWSNGATTSSITVGTAGSYTVQVTNVNGCLSPASDPVVIALNALPAKPTITAGGPTTFCIGGSVVLTASAGSTYLWSTGATTSSITVNTAGSYSVQVTNASGCISPASDQTVVTVNSLPAKPVITPGSPTTFCTGGSVVLSSTPGSSYLWSNGATTSSITVATAGSYTVQITNASGCLSPVSDPTVVIVNALPAKPTITAGGPTTFCSGGSVVLTASAGTTYLWSTGATTSSITVGVAGSYTVQVTNVTGCLSPASDPTTITINALPAKPSITPGGPVSFCEGGNVSLTSTAGTGYVWSTGETTASISATISGSYTVQVSDINNCLSQASDPLTVTVNTKPAKPIISPVSPVDICTGSNVTLTSSPGSTYLWSTGEISNSITTAIAGNYTVSVTNAAGCLSPLSDPVVVNVNALPAKPTVSASGPTTFCSGGNVVLTSSAGTTYLWSGSETTSSVTISTGGNYSVRVTDVNGCLSPSSDAVNVVVNALPGKPVITAGGPVSFCSGGNVVLTSSAGNGYLWSTAETTSDITVVTDGTYTVQVSDINGCLSLASDPQIVTVNPLPVNIYTLNSATVCYYEDANIQMSSSENGVSYILRDNLNVPVSGPLTGSGSPLNFTVNAASIPAGVSGYNVLASSGLGCSTVLPSLASITKRPEITVTFIASATKCFGTSDGKINISAANGTGPYMVSLDNGVTYPYTTDVDINLSAGNYNLIVKDANNCLSAMQIVTISEPALLTTNAAKTDITCAGALNGTVTITTSGGTAPFTYARLPFGYQPSNTFNSLSKNTFTFSTKDANGCTSSNTVTINEPLALTIPSEIKIDNNECYGDSLGEVRILLVQGGVTPYQYSINGGLDYYPSGIFQSLPAGSYQTVVKDANGCTKTGSNNVISQPAKILINNYTQTDVTNCFGNNNGEIAIEGIGGTGGLTYKLDNLITDASGYFTGVGGGNHVLSIIDSKLCKLDTSVVLSQPVEIVFTDLLITDITGCSGDLSGEINATAGGGAGSYQYSFDNSPYQISGNFTGLAAGTFSLKAMDSNLCVKDTTIQIIEPAPVGILSDTSVNISCKSADDGSITITGTGGTAPYTYVLNPGASVTNNTGSFTALTPGAYSIEVTDSHSCGIVNSDTIILTEPTSILLDSISRKEITCNGLANGEIHIYNSGGTAPYQYSTDDKLNYINTADIPGISSGTYYMSIKDANGCILDIDTLSFSEPPALNVISENKTDVSSCHDDAAGEVELIAGGGTGTLDYSIDLSAWKSDGLFTGLIAGNYTITARDQNLCTISSSILTVDAPPAITADISTLPDLNEFNKGAITISNATGGTGTLVYSITGMGGTFSSQTDYQGLDAGDYPVVVKDDNNCTFQELTTVPSVPALDVTVQIGRPSCFGVEDGTITMISSNAMPAVEYSIDDSTSWDSNGSFTNLGPGVYYIFMRDGLQRYFQDTVEIIQPLNINVFASITPASCSSYTNDGVIDVTVNGGTSPYTYEWADGQITQDINQLGIGDYNLTVTDSKSCTSEKSFTVTATTTVIADAGRDTTLCYGQSVILDGKGGNTVSWSPSEGLSNPNIGNPVVSVIENTSYVLMVVGFNDCTATDTINISIRPQLGIFAGNDTLATAQTEISLNATGGTFASYSWLPAEGLSAPDQQTTLAHPQKTTTYIVTGETEFGCTETDTVQVRVAERIKIYDVFSPNNGDDLNNFFEIDNAELYPDIVVEVFTRWGEKVFSSTGYSDDKRWDGTYKGKDVPIGTYYYVVVPSKGAEAITGPLTIVR